jgi:L-threonylcarbamoyladenylate synthase
MKKPEGLKLTEGFKISKNTSVIPSHTRDLHKAASVLRRGGIVIFPTDTVYGIGCRFDDQKAIERLYQIKNAPKDQPFPILVSNINQVKQLAKVTGLAQKLIDKYWPGALTIIFPGSSTYSKPGSEQLCEPGLNTEKIGFRMPNSKLVLDLINEVGVPIIGTSANFHDQKPPKSFVELDPRIIQLADFTIKGRCQKGIQSTVIDATSGPPKILRQGAIRISQINQLTN